MFNSTLGGDVSIMALCAHQTKIPMTQENADLNVNDLDLTALPEDALNGLLDRIVDAKVLKLIDSLEHFKDEYQALITRIEASVLPLDLTANKYLSMKEADLKAYLRSHVKARMSPTAPGAAPAPRRRGTVAPKYRHPDNPQLTWTGRGNKPIWVRDFLAAGNDISAALISPAANQG